MKKKIKKKNVLVSIGIVIILFITAIIVIINVFFAKKDLNTKKLVDESVYIYYSDEKFDYTGNLTLNREGNITSLLLDKQQTKLYNEPIYYAKKEGLILPVHYSVCFPQSSGRQNKVSYYTELIKTHDDYFLVHDGLNYKLNHDFLFDGKDYYIFVDDADVQFSNQHVSITPFSFVNYVYDSHELYIYNYQDDKLSHYDNVTDDVIVTNDYYKVNLSADSIIINGKDKLLMKNFDYLKKLK